MSPNAHLDSFKNKVKRTRRLLGRQIELLQLQKIPKTDLESIYELSFMNVFVAFENDLIELFKTNLLMTHGRSGKVRSLYRPNSRPAADKLLLGTNKHFQILPVDQMEKIARVYLKDGGPFVALSLVQKTGLGKAIAIRNHIAHKSPSSRKAFQTKVLSQINLPKSSFSPGYYLRSGLAQNITYFDHHVSEIGSCLKHIVDNS